MIRNMIGITVFEGCTTDMHKGDAQFDYYSLGMSCDHAWEVVESLLRQIREGKNIVSLDVWEEIES